MSDNAAVGVNRSVAKEVDSNNCPNYAGKTKGLATA